MKKHIIAIALTALAAASCSRGSQDAEPVSIDSAKTFEDTVSIAIGNRLGLVALYDVVQNVPEGVDKAEMWRGAMTVMDADTANVSYIYGLAMGEMLMRNYRMIGSRTAIDKKLFLSAVKGMFMRDTLPDDAELQEVVRLYNLVFEQLETNERAAADAKIFDTEEAKQNRMLADAVETKLKADGAYQAVGNTGILANVTTPGSGKPFAQNSYPVLDVTLSRPDSGAEIIKRENVMFAMGNIQDPLFASILPLLSEGETATFYVPYAAGYGVQGNPTLGIGPCESVMATITVKEVK